MISLSTIIEAIRERCPTFNQNVAGAAEWKDLQDYENPTYPAAYVVPLSEEADAQESPNGYRQTVTETFGVIVLATSDDARGQSAIEMVREQLRPELFHALLAWSPDPSLYSEIIFEGAQVIYLDSARMGYQFEFSYEYYLDAEDAYQAEYLASLPEMHSMALNVGIAPDLKPELSGNVLINLEK